MRERELLSKSVKWLTLGEISEKPMYGSGARAINGNPKEDYRYVRISDIDDHGSLSNDWKTADKVEEKYFLHEGDLLFARSGATVGKTFLYRESFGKAIFAGYLIRFIVNCKIALPRYVYYCANTSRYWNWVSLVKSSGSQPNISAKTYQDFAIPLPSLEEQQRIVDILDKFDALVNDISQGLPAEIEARRKQYEYYRDKLLTFKEKVD